MILAADVGGTKTLVGLFKVERDRLRVVREARYSSQGHASLPKMLQSFLAAGPRRKLTGVAVGVAGPVVRGRSHVVNLRWPVDARRLARVLDVPTVQVINDLEATAWGIPELPRGAFEVLTPGLRAEPAGNAALIAAGTGLGMALLVRHGKGFLPLASEGGHQEFGPRDDVEIELLRFLRQRHGRVSTERVVAGPAFSAIFQFLIESGRGKLSPAMAERLAAADDENRAISEAGLAGEDPVAEQAVEMFVSLYGSAAGDLALVAKATGGIYVGGGIAPKILSRLKSGPFVRSFQSKGRLSPVLEKIPVKVVLEPRTALIGAAACALRLPRMISKEGPRR